MAHDVYGNKTRPERTIVGTITAASSIASSVSGIATIVQEQLSGFLNSNPSLSFDSKAIILKQEENASKIFDEMTELRKQLDLANKQLQDAKKLRSKLPDMLLSGLIGAIIGFVLGYLAHFL